MGNGFRCVARRRGRDAPSLLIAFLRQANFREIVGCRVASVALGSGLEAETTRLLHVITKREKLQ
jgi:hypothetical protein